MATIAQKDEIKRGLELSVSRYVLEKDTLRLFPIGATHLPVVEAQPDKRHANKTKISGSG